MEEPSPALAGSSLPPTASYSEYETRPQTGILTPLISVCVSFGRFNMKLESDWIVVVGTVSVSDPSQGKRYQTLQIKPHPGFSLDNNDYDLCLLRTRTEIEMGGEFTPDNVN